MNNFNIDDVIEFVKNQASGTRVYLGADSRRYLNKNNEWWATYTVVVVVHKNASNGCKIFGTTSNERDYDNNQAKPSLRLMNEVYKVSEMYAILSKNLDVPIEVHLDISADPQNGSSCIVQQAIGYIRGTCNVIPMTKPNAFAASCAADRYTSIKKQA